MSSDYLDYDLAKELHDLGVVFTEGDAIFLDGNITRPSTAQLIDEIARRRYFMLTIDEDANEFDVSILVAGDDSHSNSCATTALGKALIALVKEIT